MRPGHGRTAGHRPSCGGRLRAASPPAPGRGRSQSPARASRRTLWHAGVPARAWPGVREKHDNPRHPGRCGVARTAPFQRWYPATARRQQRLPRSAGSASSGARQPRQKGRRRGCAHRAAQGRQGWTQAFFGYGLNPSRISACSLSGCARRWGSVCSASCVRTRS